MLQVPSFSNTDQASCLFSYIYKYKTPHTHTRTPLTQTQKKLRGCASSSRPSPSSTPGLSATKNYRIVSSIPTKRPTFWHACKYQRLPSSRLVSIPAHRTTHAIVRTIRNAQQQQRQPCRRRRESPSTLARFDGHKGEDIASMCNC